MKSLVRPITPVFHHQLLTVFALVSRARELEDQVDQLQSKLSATTEALQKYPKPSDVDDLRGQLQGAVAKYVMNSRCSLQRIAWHLACVFSCRNAGLAKVIEEREQRIEGLVQANSRLDALKASAEAEIAAVRSRNELLGDANSELMRRIEAMEPSRGSVPEAESSDSPIVEALQSQVKELERLLNEERMRWVLSGVFSVLFILVVLIACSGTLFRSLR